MGYELFYMEEKESVLVQISNGGMLQRNILYGVTSGNRSVCNVSTERDGIYKLALQKDIQKFSFPLCHEQVTVFNQSFQKTLMNQVKRLKN